MPLPSKQQAIIDYIRTNGSITTKVANEMLKDFYYHNHEHYVSEILSRMVKAGKIYREKIGVYKLGKHPSDVVVKNQISLL